MKKISPPSMTKESRKKVEQRVTNTSDRLNNDIQAFLARGGKIMKVGQGVTGYEAISLASPKAKLRTIETTMKQRELRSEAARNQSRKKP